ncbi:MAG TPA: hypothetical protein DDX39_11475 [Bacteroidales bacterium]|nr:MAG: hypothetical protein A2W98_14070 [Bacteroidetes bacterium GWF2_33_38]OFY75318.1 MAG: hypothetical protein A2265_04700 [Bacteroidetes bacterium RIFOXYA12_FULL_33_9]HBF89250.1 hypothetical protein [Bacteroidales bacterium]
MQVNQSGAKYSAIVGIGERIKKLSAETGEKYLLLNRGVNSVCNIDLSQVVKEIDFNSTKMQVYPSSQGLQELREAINATYFENIANDSNIYITAGGMSGLDLIFQTLNVEKIYLPSYFWGSYMNVMKIRNIKEDFYDSFSELTTNIENLKNSAVVICDPNNPIGGKYSDEKLLSLIKLLNDNGVVIIYDSPYRRIFFETDNFYAKLLTFPELIIVDSFSKSVGLSGQRIGFVHSVNQDFNHELGIRLMYATNGINAFSQILIQKLLTSVAGKKAVTDFKTETCDGIRKNIEYLKSKKLLATEFYHETEPKGIFVIVNKSEQELLEKKIASVSLSFFTRKYKATAEKYARICVSVPHNEFVEFMSRF